MSLLSQCTNGSVLLLPNEILEHVERVAVGLKLYHVSTSVQHAGNEEAVVERDAQNLDLLSCGFQCDDLSAANPCELDKVERMP